MVAIITTIVGFILTGVVGNRLLQNWQARNWLNQQNFLASEKEYDALKALSVEVSGAIAKRMYRTRRLLLIALSGNLNGFESAKSEYSESVKQWNEILPVFTVKMVFYADYDFSRRLEESIAREFSAISAGVDRSIRNTSDITQHVNALRSALARLDRLNAYSFEFNRDVLGTVERKRVRAYTGDKIAYSDHNIDKFSTYELIEALFIRDVDAHAVPRPPLYS